jgi:hypothetical protein
MTAPDGFTIFKDEPLLSKENGKDVQMHFQRLHDAILHTRGDGGDKAECNTSTTENSAIGAMNRVGRDSSTADVGAERARTDEQSAKDFPHETKAKIRSGLWTVRGSEVIPKRVDAIWKDSKGGVRLARGEHTLIAGEPGLGKSQTVIAAGAAVTKAGYWPCGEGRAPLGSLIILAAEDSIEHTLVPRLIAAGADLSRVYFVQAAVTEDGKGRRTFNFQADLAKLKELIKDTSDAVLVIIDPVTAYMGKIDGHKNTDVRGVLAPLGELAQECNVAILSVTHFTKGTGRRPGCGWNLRGTISSDMRLSDCRSAFKYGSYRGSELVGRPPVSFSSRVRHLSTPSFNAEASVTRPDRSADRQA